MGKGMAHCEICGEDLDQVNCSIESGHVTWLSKLLMEFKPTFMKYRWVVLAGQITYGVWSPVQNTTLLKRDATSWGAWRVTDRVLWLSWLPKGSSFLTVPRPQLDTFYRNLVANCATCSTDWMWRCGSRRESSWASVAMAIYVLTCLVRLF